MPPSSIVARLPRRARLGPVVVLALLGGCDLFEPKACDTGIEPAVTVAVVDAVTGLPAADGARGVVQDGAYRDSLRVVRRDAANRATHLGAADARGGTYTIVVEKPGYATWSVTNVRTGSDGCHATAREQRAMLTPLP